ncbi:MAG: acyltransferase family protein [Candidatus Hodarchaeales archaeon]
MNTESEEFKRPRLIFLDNIKLLFAILVIFQHVRVTYGGTGWWYYIESNPYDPFSFIFFLLVTSIGGLFQASLMGLFFLMGGYLTPRSYDRKGVKLFWRERLIRLGIPLLLYIVLIHPIMVYILSALGVYPWITYPTQQGSLLDFYLSKFQSLEGLIGFLTSSGPMWFLFVLLLFTGGYTLWRQITRFDSLQQYIPKKELAIPRYLYFLLLAIILGGATFIVRIAYPIDTNPLGIQLPFLIQYILMFSVGVIAVRYDWFEKMSKDHIKVWSSIIAATFALFFLYVILVVGVDSDFNVFTGGFTIPALVFALADNVITMGMIFVLIPIFYAKFNTQGPLLQNLSSSSYHIYLIHAPILVLISLAFASIPLFPVIKLAIVFPVTILLCYLLSHFILQKIF